MAVLQPTLNSSDIEYSTVVPFMEQTLTLVPMVPEGGRVTIDGTPVPSGTPWQSPRLALGVNFLTIVVSQSGQPSRTYRLRVDVSPG
jgi:hypothetical protein